MERYLTTLKQSFRIFNVGFAKDTDFGSRLFVVHGKKLEKKVIDPRKKYSELLTDLSNAPDFLANDLLVTKLNSYGFSIVSLNLINDYSTQLKQSVKINNSAHGWIFYLMCLKSLF